ncbi:hypothetical protein [Mitsuokella multacida]|uniref:hypothetical protein n=1 Tax=Mitsuokella multacida TaxID=52226 RepID=UPI00242A448B|nr:hypothetical protein [Mitsuokella multacida]
MEITTSRKFSKGKSAFENIARLQNQICGSKDKDVIISFKESKRYGQSFIFLLGCLTMLGAQEDKNVKLRLPERLEHKFRGMSILDYEKHSTNGAHSFFQIKDANDLIGLIQDNIQGVPIEMSDKLTETMVSLIAEIYNNARDHSQSNYIIGGCYRKSRTKSHSHRFSLSCYDAGIGIIESVAEYLLPISRKDIEDILTPELFQQRMLAWALKRGNSTKGGPRGLGMSMLLDFAKVNHGIVTICDQNILFQQLETGRRSYHIMPEPFRGCFFEIEIVDDPDRRYMLRGE